MANVLLVEDEPLISMMLEGALEDLGHSIIGVANTVERALALLRARAPDLAVVDLRLGDEFCYELVAELKHRHIPFVMVTGSCIDGSDARLAGVEVLAKPLDERAFRSVVERLTLREPLALGCSVCTCPDDALA
jgi:CheY-like chemotaxis protein